MNTKANFTNNSWNSFNWHLAALALALTVPGRAETQTAAIPISDIGARATAGYQGDALGVTATADGARLRCGFQKLEGQATPEGLWLESTRAGGGRLRLVAKTLGREETLVSSAQGACAGGTSENSPAFRRWDRCGQAPSREATAELAPRFGRPFGTSPAMRPNPALKRWAIVNSPSGTELTRTGEVSVSDQLVRFTRPGLTEEYSVSVDGVRQDFIIESPPPNPPPSAVLSTLRSTATEDGLQRTGHPLRRAPATTDSSAETRSAARPSTLNQSAGDLRLELALSGARAEATACGVRLRLDGSGRTLAYSRLRVEDATGRELTARLEVLSADRLVLSVADANATYPVRIDPTFSDAQWVSLSPGVPGTYPGVYALAMDGSGNVYVGGAFSLVGTVPANRIAKWSGSAWSALGSGMDVTVHVLAVSGSNVYAGGQFTTAGGVPANYIAKWDGQAWSALGTGMNSYVYALAVSGSDLYAGGTFNTAGGVTSRGLAKWNGSAWSSLGSGINTLTDGISALAVSGTDLYAGGSFTNVGGVMANYIAKWDGGNWSPLGAGLNGGVSTLAVSGTTLYAGGGFTWAGGVTATNIAKWDGRAWSALGSGISGGPASCVYTLAVSGTNLYAGGWFTTAGGVPANYIAKWNGSAWSALGSGMNGGINALAVSETNLYVGGGFSTAGGVLAINIAEWNGGAWSALGTGMSSSVHALALSGTSLYAGGESGVAQWNGSAWSALGSGLGGNYSSVSALAVVGTDLYAGGHFTTVGGVPANLIAKWNGSAWSALGSGLNGDVNVLAVVGADLYAGGGFTTAGGMPANYIAKWNGSAWSAVGSGMNDAVYVLAVSETNLYAGGRFATAGGVSAKYIAKWDGSTWSALGSGMDDFVTALAVSGTNVYAGGYFSTAGGVPTRYIAKWDASTWSALGSGMTLYYGQVYALAVNGTDLYAGGSFYTAGGVSANYIAKWDGSAWTALGSGMNNDVWALTVDGADHLFVGGGFSQAGGKLAFYVAEAILRPSVPTILEAPPTQTAEAGSVVDLSVEVSGSLPLFCVWYLNDTNLIICSTNCEQALTNVQFSESGSYTLVVSNALGAVTSAPIMLSVIAPVERRPVPGVNLTGEAGSLLNVDYANSLSATPNWTTLSSISLTSTTQYYFDLTLPLPPQRYFRAWQTGTPGVTPSLDLHVVPAITLTGNIGHSVRLDYINRFGPIDAWVTVDTVTLTNTSQLYFDVSAPGQPQRLYRLVPSP